MESALDAFQGRVARRLTGRMSLNGRDGKWIYPPPGGGYQGGGDRESQYTGPLETEYGRAIHCDATDSGTLRGGGAAEGDTGPTAMVGATRDRLETVEGKVRKGSGNSGTRGSTCRGDRDTRIGNGNGGGGVTGGQWLQRGRMERGGGLRPLARANRNTHKQST